MAAENEVSDSDIKELITQQYEKHGIKELLENAVELEKIHNHGKPWLMRRLKIIKDGFITNLYPKLKRLNLTEKRFRKAISEADKIINFEFSDLTGDEFIKFNPDLDELNAMQERHEAMAAQRAETQRVRRPQEPSLYDDRNRYRNPDLRKKKIQQRFKTGGIVPSIF